MDGRLTATINSNGDVCAIQKAGGEGVMSSVLKWFYDIFTGAATGAVRCGSFVGESFGLLVVSYG
jgi:exosome complex RNA-binding protein Rrp42 (RNase PH superfamily)